MQLTFAKIFCCSGLFKFSGRRVLLVVLLHIVFHFTDEVVGDCNFY